MMKVTLNDIAKATGFSVNTVSHALSGKPDISEKTKAIIKDAAEKLGYMKNYAASCMRTGKSMTVAIIIPDIKNPYFSVVLREIVTPTGTLPLRITFSSVRTVPLRRETTNSIP